MSHVSVHDTGCVPFGRRCPCITILVCLLCVSSLSVLSPSPFTFLQLPSCPPSIHPFTDQPAESVSRFKQWFWSVVEKMTNEENHDLVRQRMPLLVVGAWACGIGPYAGQLEVHKFGKAQNSYEYVHQLM